MSDVLNDLNNIPWNAGKEKINGVEGYITFSDDAQDLVGFTKNTIAGREAYFFVDSDNNFLRTDKSGNLLDKDGNYIEVSNDNNYVFAVDPNNGTLGKRDKNNLVSDALENTMEALPNDSVVSPYELIMDGGEKTKELLGDISDFYEKNRVYYESVIKGIDDNIQELQKNLNTIQDDINNFDNKSEEERAKLGGTKEEIQNNINNIRNNVLKKVEEIKGVYETFKNFTEAASENAEKVREMYDYYNSIKDNTNIPGAERDEARQTFIETLKGLHEQAEGFQSAVNGIVEYNNKVIKNENIGLNKAAIDCQLEIIKKRTELEQKNSQQINNEQLRLWKDKFSGNERVRNSVTPERENNLKDCRNKVNDDINVINTKNDDFLEEYDTSIGNGKDNIKNIDITAISSSLGTSLSDYQEGSLSCYRVSKDPQNRVMSWSGVKDIKTFIKFIESQFSDDIDGAKEYYKNHKDKISEKKNFIGENIDTAIKAMEYGKKALAGEKGKDPGEQAKDCIKFEMVNYLVGEGNNGSIDMETAKRMAELAEFDKQPLKQYTKNLETIYKKKNKVLSEGNNPITLEAISNALEQGVEENSIGLKRRFITKKTKESARNINNLIMGAIVDECKGEDFDKIEPLEKQTEILNSVLANFKIGDGVTTNSLLASDSRASALVMQGLKNINSLAEKSARNEEVLKECDNQINTQMTNAADVIKEKGARCASKYYKNKMNEEKGFTKDEIEKRRELQKKSNDFKKKEGDFKKGIKRVDNFLKPFLNTVDKDKIRRKNITINDLKNNKAIDTLNFDDIRSKMEDKKNGLKSQLKSNREKQQNSLSI